MPPDFADQVYWDARFRGEEAGFEWLVDCDKTTTKLEAALRSLTEPQPKLLHIGCGSSKLSLRLRDLVQQPQQVLNTDYAASAIELGQRWEREIFTSGQSENNNTSMKWQVGDLLSTSFADKLRTIEGPFDVVVDKSTSDAIVCGDDILLSGGDWDHLIAKLKLPPSIANLQIAWPPDLLLAFHLALLTKPGGFWLCWSYSSSRFDFSTSPNAEEADISYNTLVGLLSSLWTQEQREGVEALEQLPVSGDSPVHRPKIQHWVYTLRRNV